MYFQVVDMFGCELPVAAYRNENFVALPELVVHGITGKVFCTPQELARELKDWFNDFGSPSYNERNDNFKNNIKEFKKENWEKHWT